MHSVQILSTGKRKGGNAGSSTGNDGFLVLILLLVQCAGVAAFAGPVLLSPSHGIASLIEIALL